MPTLEPPGRAEQRLAWRGKPDRLRTGNPRRIGLAGRRLPPPDDRRDPKFWLEVVGWHTPTKAWFAPIAARRSCSPPVSRSSTPRRGSRTNRSAAPPAVALAGASPAGDTGPRGPRTRRCAHRAGGKPSFPSNRGATAPSTAAIATAPALRARRSARTGAAGAGAAGSLRRTINAAADSGIYSPRGP